MYLVTLILQKMWSVFSYPNLTFVTICLFRADVNCTASNYKHAWHWNLLNIDHTSLWAIPINSKLFEREAQFVRSSLLYAGLFTDWVCSGDQQTSLLYRSQRLRILTASPSHESSSYSPETIQNIMLLLVNQKRVIWGSLFSLGLRAYFSEDWKLSKFGESWRLKIWRFTFLDLKIWRQHCCVICYPRYLMLKTVYLRTAFEDSKYAFTLYILNLKIRIMLLSAGSPPL